MNREAESGSKLTCSTKIAFHKCSSFFTSANCSDLGTGTKREQCGGAETDIYFSMLELMVGCIIIQQPSLNHRWSVSTSFSIQSFKKPMLNNSHLPEMCCNWARRVGSSEFINYIQLASKTTASSEHHQPSFAFHLLGTTWTPAKEHKFGQNNLSVYTQVSGSFIRNGIYIWVSKIEKFFPQPRVSLITACVSLQHVCKWLTFGT